MFRRRSGPSESDFPGLVTSGVAQLHAGDRDGALRSFQQASQANDPLTLRRLGAAYVEAGETGYAEYCYYRAAEAGSLDARNDLGILLKQTGRLAEAEAVLRQAADAGDPNASNNLGNLFQERGDLQGAAWFWHRAAEAGNPRAMCSLGVFLANSGHPDARLWHDRAQAKVFEAPEIRVQLESLSALLNGPAPGASQPGTSQQGDAQFVGTQHDQYAETQLVAAAGQARTSTPPQAPEAPAAPAAAEASSPSAAFGPGGQVDAAEPTSATVRRPRRPETPRPGSLPAEPAWPGYAQASAPPAPASSPPEAVPPLPSWPAPASPMPAPAKSSPPAQAPAPKPTPSVPGGRPLLSRAMEAPTTLVSPSSLSTPAPPSSTPSPAPSPSSAVPNALSDALGTAERLRERYLETGDAAALGKALEASEVALESAPASAAEARGHALSLRCVLLRLAYLRDRDTVKLAEAIESGRTARSLLKPADPAFARAINGLAAALQEEYGQTHDPAILTEALSLYREGARVLPEGHPDIPGLYSNIGNVLMTQGLADGNARLLAEAVQAGREAIGMSDPEGPSFGSRLAHLGMALVAHYANCDGPPAELDEAERLFNESLATLPPAHQLRAQIQSYLNGISALRLAQ